MNASQSGATPDGKTWATAFPTLPAALASPGVGEIWVACGTYYPTAGTERDATFKLRAGAALYGGFGGGETQRNERDWEQNQTILSGDIGRPGEAGDNSYHVVTGADEAVLDGFTITGGNGLGGDRRGPPDGGTTRGGGRGGAIHMTPQGILAGANASAGAGLVNFQAAPTVRNCIFEYNQAGKGGGVYNMTSTAFPPRPDANRREPVFINCVFRHNTARGRGGAISNDLGTSPTFLNCVFEANETPQKGGGMYNDFGCSPTLINCLFTGNRAQSAGGMGNDGGSSPVLQYCTFTKNHAEDYGAPLYQGTGPASNPSLLSCQIFGNTCDWGEPGIYNWHANTPLIQDTADSGYRPGRFTAAQLPTLLRDLARYQAQPGREPAAAAAEPIPSAAESALMILQTGSSS